MTLCRVIHVDDEIASISKLEKLLKAERGIKYLGGFLNAASALEFLGKEDVDLIFLDIEMPGNNGLWLAGQLQSGKHEIAFVTSHAGYATKAFEACALDYILKPIDADKVHILLERLRYKKAQGIVNTKAQIEAISRYLDPKQRPNRIFINTISTTEIIKLDEVLYLSSANNYTFIVINNGEKHTASRTIRTFEEALDHHPDFLRISRSYIINKNYIKAIKRDGETRKFSLLMTNGDLLETAYKTKEQLLNRLDM